MSERRGGFPAEVAFPKLVSLHPLCQPYTFLAKATADSCAPLTYLQFYLGDVDDARHDSVPVTVGGLL